MSTLMSQGSQKHLYSGALIDTGLDAGTASTLMENDFVSPSFAGHDISHQTKNIIDHF